MAEPFTYSYSQPESYHFCQDSVLFPRFVAERLKTERITTQFRALDVCAGCGVIGFELAFHRPEIPAIDFLEIQEEFAPHFDSNLRITARNPETHRLLLQNYSALKSEEYREKYDLIVANPPYFYSDEGRLTPSKLKNRCRFFLDSDLKTLIEGTVNALKLGGEAYLLIKAGARHGRKAYRDLELWIAGAAETSVAGPIRGTDVIQITKQASPNSCQR